jgi:hypothetical protein
MLSSKRSLRHSALLFIIILSLLNIFFQPVLAEKVESSQPLRLVVYVSPPALPADGRAYACVYVQVQDLEGRPCPAPFKVNVTLTSSNLEVGTVQGEVVIAEGETFAVAPFNTTNKAGLTIITASASGLMSGSAFLTTVNPSGASPPFKLNVYAQSPVPCEAGLSGAIVVQAVGSNGLPLPMPKDIVVFLASSNTTVVDVPSFVVIPAGAYYAKSSFNVKGAPGRSVVTALADGFLPSSAEVVVARAGGEPSKLLLALTPPVLAPDGCLHEGVIQVQLLDSAGLPAKATRDVHVYVSSSNPEACAALGPVTVRRGEFFASASVKAGLKAGEALITVAASGLEAASSLLRVVGSTPSRLALYAALPLIPADGKPRNVLVVQVQDENGAPVASNRELYVRLTSSSPRVGQVPALLVIERGASTVTVPFIPALPGVVNVTASTNGLGPSTTSVEVWAPSLSLSIEAPSTVRLNQTFSVRARVSYGGLPVEGATVEWMASGAQLVAAEGTTNADGCATATLRQVSERALLTVRASKPGFSEAKSSKSVTAMLPVERSPSINILGLEVPALTLALALAIIVVALVAAYVVVKLRLLRRA